ncbi:hypothetical protein [Oleomonas cavernae]|uniref:hypothetical protein n=1 Tax=Oleomonas cavernae TaxID=2320859 RepID=UPI0011C3A38A|nr:hypothetical protein [Oleomonas cavernae]
MRHAPAWVLAMSVLHVAAPASAKSPPACDIADPTVITRQADLPSAARAAIPFTMADPGEPFHVTDVISPGTEDEPFRRLICAYPYGGGLVIQYEQGGFAYGVMKLLLERSGDRYFAR